jgi:hypothetical protein
LLSGSGSGGADRGAEACRDHDERGADVVGPFLLTRRARSTDRGLACGAEFPGTGSGCGETDLTRSPAMRSTIASATARPASIRSSPGWPITTPVIVVRLACTKRIARNAKHPPAALSEPVFTPTKPLCPRSVLVLCTVPATGNVALDVATMFANTGRCRARSTMSSWSAAVETVVSS